jgi:hypothetical protein
MHDEANTTGLLDCPDVGLEPEAPASRRRVTLRGVALSTWRGIASGSEWLFGLLSLLLGLSMLAALPVLQLLSLGYLLESSGRVARTGRLRDGLIGVRRAARVGGAVAGTWLALIPPWLVRSFALSAELIDPGGPVARGWRAALAVVTVLTAVHIAAAWARGGRLRHFLWPFGHPVWLYRSSAAGGCTSSLAMASGTFAASLHLPYYFRSG